MCEAFLIEVWLQAHEGLCGLFPSRTLTRSLTDFIYSCFTKPGNSPTFVDQVLMHVFQVINYMVERAWIWACIMNINCCFENSLTMLSSNFEQCFMVCGCTFWQWLVFHFMNVWCLLGSCAENLSSCTSRFRLGGVWQTGIRAQGCSELASFETKLQPQKFSFQKSKSFHCM